MTPSHTKGKFITLEGSEGVGKSSNLPVIKALLEQAGHEVVMTREPGGTPLAEKMRDILLSKHEEHLFENSELLLMFAARAQHLQHLILPALQRGAWVLSDRFTDATFAYQGGGRALSWALIETLESIVQGNLQPDLTILLDAPTEIGLARMHARGTPDRFESEHVAFFERVRQAYLKRAKADPERFAVIDAAQPLEAVQLELRHSIQEFVESV